MTSKLCVVCLSLLKKIQMIARCEVSHSWVLCTVHSIQYTVEKNSNDCEVREVSHSWVYTVYSILYKRRRGEEVSLWGRGWMTELDAMLATLD